MSAVTPNPNASTALALMGRSLWVVPLTGYKKNPPKFGERTHGDILNDNDKTFLDAVVLAQQHTATGWAAILRPTDPVPLAVVDVDAYGVTLDAAWAMLTAEPMPAGLSVVKSATGGFHFWFRLPDADTAKRLPGTWDFGQGRKGEIRASREALQLIVLPGSVARNKHGDLGKYELVGHPLSDLDGLALMPSSLLARLCGHGAPAPAREGMPTEAAHFAALLHLLGPVPPGEQNARVAQVGQILGRIGPADKPGPDLVSLAWDTLRDKLPAAHHADPWTFTKFERAFVSGYKTGAKSRNKHTPETGTAPTPDDVNAEMISLFGSLPWLIKVTDSKGQFQEYLLGHGGSPAERDKATSICSIKDQRLPHLLAELSRLIPSVDQNALTRSPLFLDPAWSKVMRHTLLVEYTPERIGNDPEARFWEILNEWARGAAGDGKFLDTMSGPWRHLDSKQWIVQSPEEPAVLCLHPDAVERLYSRIGDMPAVKRLLNTHTRPRALKSNGSHKQLVIAAEHLAPETRAHIAQGYNLWIANKTKEQKNEPAKD